MKLRLQQPGIRGFTLIELMIVVTIVAILAGVALPLYSEHVLQSRRSEARAAIEEIRNLQYEFFQNYKKYGDRDDIGYPAKTPGGYYDISVSGSALQFSATTTATGKQAKDTDCYKFAITSVGILQAYKKDTTTNNPDCW